MSKINHSCVRSNLLQQNCFVRSSVQRNDVCNSSAPDSFCSVDEIVTQKGVELNFREESYPITPQYVASFADSADYRKDLVSAFNSPARGQNLGDITDIQKVSSMDSEGATLLYRQLQDNFSKQSESVVSESVPASTIKSPDSEVK